MVVNIMVPQHTLTTPIFRAKDPISALTHFIGFLAAIIGTPILLMKGALDGKNLMELFSLTIFGLSMIFLYGASTTYHAFQLKEEKSNKALKKLDHMMIAILVAGTYTPICVTSLREVGGLTLLAIVWGLAVLSIIFKAFWVTCPKWISSVIYLGMGWACAPYLKSFHAALTDGGFRLLLLGGIVYSIGAVIYAMKPSILEKNRHGFGNHELFHLFVMGGTFFQYLMILNYVA